MNASGNPQIVKWWKGRELPSSWWPHGVTQLDAPPALSFGSRFKSYNHVLLELFSSDYHPGDFSTPSTSPSKVPTIDSRVIDEPLPTLDTEMRILVSPLSFHFMPPKKDAGFTAKRIKGRQVHFHSSRLFHRSVLHKCDLSLVFFTSCFSVSLGPPQLSTIRVETPRFGVNGGSSRPMNEPSG